MADPILICDDDADIRGAMRRTLRGYDVVETAAEVPIRVRAVNKLRAALEIVLRSRQTSSDS